MNKGKKTLILVRHAHRDNQDPDQDNGLSKKGQKQSLALCQNLAKFHDLKNAQLYSSPRKRCVETLMPLSRLTNRKIEISPYLDERDDQESAGKFKKRIQEFIKHWKSDTSPLTIACSHGDWLPLAVTILTSSLAEFEKGGWAEFVYSKGKTILQFRN